MVILTSSWLALGLFLVSSDVNALVTRYVSSAPARRDSTPLPLADFEVSIAAKQPMSKARKALRHSLRKHHGSESTDASTNGTAPGNFTTPLAGSDFDQEYLVNVTVGGQAFSLIVDTGSSDTWVAEKGFKCSNLNGKPVSTSTCAFGTAGFDTTKSSTFQTDPNLNFNITYGDGEFLNGAMGLETITVGGMSVPKQEFGLVTAAAWEGDGVNTGLMGLAYPALTSAFKGTDPSKDQFPQTQVTYNPIFFTAVQQGLVSNPFFSLALGRGTLDQESNDKYDPGLGSIAFGGVPDVPITSTAVTVPVQGLTASGSASSTAFSFYTVDVQGYTFTGSTKVTTANNSTILDSGTTLNYLPTPVADAYNAAFSPKAVFNNEQGAYQVVCSTKVPEFNVTIGGTTFGIDAKDQLLPIGTQDKNGNDLCITGTNDGGSVGDGNTFILGDVFLHNVVATFNIQSNEITLTQRQPY